MSMINGRNPNAPQQNLQAEQKPETAKNQASRQAGGPPRAQSGKGPAVAGYQGKMVDSSVHHESHGVAAEPSHQKLTGRMSQFARGAKATVLGALQEKAFGGARALGNAKLDAKAEKGAAKAYAGKGMMMSALRGTKMDKTSEAYANKVEAKAAEKKQRTKARIDKWDNG